MSKVRVLHIWRDYTPGLFDETHSLPSIDPDFESRLVCDRLILTGSAVATHVYSAIQTGNDAFLNRSLVSRLKRRAASGFATHRAKSMARRLVRDWHPKIIHFHFGYAAAEATWFARNKHGAAGIVSFYGVDASACLKDERWIAKYRSILPQMDCILVLCNEVRDRLVSLGLDRSRICQWNLPAGIEKYQSLRRTKTGTTIRFLSAARFVEKKGQSLLLRAFQELLSRGVPARLTLLGYGPLHAMLLAERDRLGLGEHVRIINTELRSDFVEIYRRELADADVFVLPSIVARDGDDEGGPALTMVCAQATGLPAISTPFPGSEITLAPGESGLHCESGDVPSLCNAMANIAGDRQGRERMGLEGARLAKKHFSRDGQLKTLREFYRALT